MIFKLEEIDNVLNYIRDLYDLAKEFEVPVPEDDIENYNVNIIITKYEIIDNFKLNNIQFQKFSIVLTSLRTTFEEINNEQDKLIDEFEKKIDIHIEDILREVNRINIEANVMDNTYLLL